MRNFFDLREREETIDRLLEYEHQNSSMLQMVPFTVDLEGRQKRQIEKEERWLGLYLRMKHFLC